MQSSHGRFGVYHYFLSSQPQGKYTLQFVDTKTNDHWQRACLTDEDCKKEQLIQFLEKEDAKLKLLKVSDETISCVVPKEVGNGFPLELDNREICRLDIKNKLLEIRVAKLEASVEKLEESVSWLLEKFNVH